MNESKKRRADELVGESTENVVVPTNKRAKTNTIFEEGAFLKVYDNIVESSLVRACVKETSDLLEIRPPIILWGTPMNQPRDVRFFSNHTTGYTYSKRKAEAKPLTPSLVELLRQVNLHFNTDFNGILVNRYPNGDSYVCSHADDECDLVDDLGVVALSFGAERTFRVRDFHTKQIKADIQTKSCQFIHMGGSEFQKKFKHEITKTKKVHSARYSFTFRTHKEEMLGDNNDVVV